MITGDFDQLKSLVDNNVCAADNGRLNVAWNKDTSQYYLKCGICGECKSVLRVLSLTEEHKAGTELPEPIKSNVEKGIKKRAERLPSAPQAETFSGIPAADLATGELIPVEVLRGLVSYARKYGLDPARGHVCLMHGKPYITIDGYLYYAKSQGNRYALHSRPLDDEEKKLYQIPEGAHAWLSTVSFPDLKDYCAGIGIVTKQELEAKSTKHPDQLRSPVVAAHPWQLAQKRAEWQALRRAFPIGETKEGVNNE